MARIVTFGEVMLRLATPDHLRMLQTNHLEMTFGGGEANVAVSVSQFGHKGRFVTRLPNNDVAQKCINELQGLGVDTDYIVRAGERIGIYFLETGASQRASTVTYDRSNSAIASCKPEEFDWDAIFEGADWFHFTGITPALSDDCAEACRQAVSKAKEMGITVSTDLNFRKKLWSTEKAGEVMTSLMPYVDYCIGNEEDAEKVFGIHAGSTDVTSGKLDHQRYINVAQQLTERFGFKAVAITLRESISASQNGWSAMLYTSDQDQAHFSRRYDVTIVDRVGGGDSFAAGLITAVLNGLEAEDTIQFAVAASCLKHTIPGDYNLVKLSEVETLRKGDASGRVQR